MSKAILEKVRVVAVVTALLGAGFGVGSAQSTPTPLQTCRNALSSCNEELKDCRERPTGPNPQLQGSAGGWDWLDSQTAQDLSLLLKKAAAAERIDAKSLSAPTRELMASRHTERASRDNAGSAIHELATKLRAKEEAQTNSQSPQTAEPKLNPKLNPKLAPAAQH